MMSEKPHVVLVNKSFPPWIGGIERHVHDIGRALVHRGWRVTALVCNDRNEECRERIDGIQVVRTPQWMRVFSQPVVHGYFRILRELEPGLVHVHVPFPLGWRVIRHIDAATPLVCTWHSDIIRQRWLMPFLAPFQKRFLERCDRIIPTSQPLLDFSTVLPSYRQKCAVIPLAIPANDSPDEESIQNCVRHFRGTYPRRIVLFVGRLVGYKGLPYLLEAMKTIDADLLIAGEGIQREMLLQLSARLGIESKVHLLGSVTEVEKIALYRLADVFALPSISSNEAFGYVLLEAMQQGCPAISTELPTGVSFVNRHGESGLVVPPRDADALSTAIQKVISDADFRNRLARGAKERVQKSFRFETAIDRLEGVYGEALQSAGGRISTPAR